jgi:membrane-bound lytic murein transglycosylase D
VYQKRIEKIPEGKRSSWRFHIVHTGESLDSIASSLHGRASEIAGANHLDANASIAAGDEVVVPLANVTAALHTLHYITHASDTLVTVADRFNVSVEDLRRWNHLSSSTIKPHRTLAVSEPVRLAPAIHVRVSRAHARAGTKAGVGTKKKSAASATKSSSKTSLPSTTKKKTVATKQHNAPK